jgi:hypothetical protein
MYCCPPAVPLTLQLPFSQCSWGHLKEPSSFLPATILYSSLTTAHALTLTSTLCSILVGRSATLSLLYFARTEHTHLRFCWPDVTEAPFVKEHLALQPATLCTHFSTLEADGNINIRTTDTPPGTALAWAWSDRPILAFLKYIHNHMRLIELTLRVSWLVSYGLVLSESHRPSQIQRYSTQ